MKILELRFKNLNSLYGEWKIDFTTPEYTSNGIFAITGPTGAGKSTILDAICLALYGATPRLGKITKSSNQLMSQQTAECFAEVAFESQAGKFRCHWSQKKARRKVDGNLGESKHEIVDVETGQILESKKRDVANVIEEKTGMDFERFTRSILLAQGGFSAFLMASPDERAPILEQMTGTEIYSEISIRVHEKLREEREKLTLLQIGSSGITILSEEQEGIYSLELIDKKQQEEKLNAKIQDITKAINWLSTIDGLDKEISELSQQYETLNNELKIFQVERERLWLANKAIELDGNYATLKELRKQQNYDYQALADEELKLPEIEESAVLQEKKLNVAQQNVVKIKKDKKTLALLIQKVRSFDQQLSEKKKAIEDLEKEYAKVGGQIIDKENELKKLVLKLDFVKENLKTTREYLDKNSQDAALVSQLAGAEEQLRNLASLKKEALAKKEASKKLEEKLWSNEARIITYNTQLTKYHQTWTDIQNEVKQKKQELNQLLDKRLLREYRSEKEHLLREMAFLQKIANLEDERRKLEDGKPCPLCGSEIHPYAENNIPQSDGTEKKITSLTTLIDQAETLEQIVRELEKSENEACKQVTSVEKLKTDSLNEKQHAENALLELSTQLTKLTSSFNRLKEETIKRLLTFGVHEIPESNVEQLLNELKERLNAWNEKQQLLATIEKQIFELNGELKPLEAVIDNQKITLTEKQDTLKNINLEYQSISEDRKNIFGTKNTDIEEAELEKAVSDAESLEKLALDTKDKVKRLVEDAKVRIGSLKEQILKRTPQLKGVEKEFNDALKSSSFEDEKTYLANSLSASERNLLSHQANKLDTNKANLELKLTDRKERVLIEKSKKITESSVHELKPALLELEGNQHQVRERVTTLTIELRNQRVNKKKLQEKQALVETQKIECNRLEKLHSLIGSSDGKKYRNFAQGITFELMVSHANKQLEKMTDRYLLIRDDEQPLELNVVDNYQAGEIRTTKNLSGGESFIVSLSLALGLSKMASQKVRVDSLFLDEGFGTLDDEALETALETLGEIQQDGKMIGIISHVLALKERISTQINVQPISGGRSAISGPGCQHFKNALPINAK